MANANDKDCIAEAAALSAEVERLRGEVARLEARVRELDGLAHQDELVDLPNRRSFLKSLTNLIARVTRYGESAAMIFVDVDGLKQINDGLGHEAGDAALVQIAKCLKASTRISDCVGRLAGDEFGILLERTDELGAWQMALRVVEAVCASEIIVTGKRVRLSVAVGVGMIRGGDDAHTVLARADQQMYLIKGSGGSPKRCPR